MTRITYRSLIYELKPFVISAMGLYGATQGGALGKLAGLTLLACGIYILVARIRYRSFLR